MTLAPLAATLALALALFASSPTHAAPPAPAPAPHSRAYSTPDLLRAQRLAIAALQDLGFALESADAELGTITASRLDTHALRLTLTITATADSTITAAATTDYAGTPIADPRPAEAFFTEFARQLAPPPAID